MNHINISGKICKIAIKKTSNDSDWANADIQVSQCEKGYIKFIEIHTIAFDKEIVLTLKRFKEYKLFPYVSIKAEFYNSEYIDSKNRSQKRTVPLIKELNIIEDEIELIKEDIRYKASSNSVDSLIEINNTDYKWNL